MQAEKEKSTKRIMLTALFKTVFLMTKKMNINSSNTGQNER